jgi:hypothetical protein
VPACWAAQITFATSMRQSAPAERFSRVAANQSHEPAFATTSPFENIRSGQLRTLRAFIVCASATPGWKIGMTTYCEVAEVASFNRFVIGFWERPFKARIW